VEQRISAGSIGFNAEVANKNDLNIDELLKKVEPKDLTKFGLIPEFIGRVPVMVSLEQLTKDAMVRILSEPKNALMRQYQKLFEQCEAGIYPGGSGGDCTAGSRPQDWRQRTALYP